MGKPFYLVDHEDRRQVRCGQQSVNPWSDPKSSTGQKKTTEPYSELVLAVFLLKNTDFAFLTCSRLPHPISHVGMLTITKLSFPATLRKGLKADQVLFSLP